MLHAGLARGRHADVRRGAADVERDRAREAAAAGRVDAAQEACRRAREHEVDGRPAPVVEGGHAARRLHQVRVALQPGLAQLVVQAVQVAAHARADVGVDRCRGEALVLAMLGADLAGDRDERIRQHAADDLPDAFLVRRVGERAEEADGDGLDALAGQVGKLLLHRALVERDVHAAVHQHALRHAAAVLAQDQRPRLLRDVLHQAERVRLAVAGDVQDVPEPARGDHPHPRAAPLEDRVGADRRAVQQRRQLRRLGARHRADLLDALEDRHRRVLRRGCQLVDVDPLALLVVEDQVGERPADVHSEVPLAHQASRRRQGAEDPVVDRLRRRRVVALAVALAHPHRELRELEPPHAGVDHRHVEPLLQVVVRLPHGGAREHDRAGAVVLDRPLGLVEQRRQVGVLVGDQVRQVGRQVGAADRRHPMRDAVLVSDLAIDRRPLAPGGEEAELLAEDHRHVAGHLAGADHRDVEPRAQRLHPRVADGVDEDRVAAVRLGAEPGLEDEHVHQEHVVDAVRGLGPVGHGDDVELHVVGHQLGRDPGPSELHALLAERERDDHADLHRPVPFAVGSTGQPVGNRQRTKVARCR